MNCPFCHSLLILVDYDRVCLKCPFEVSFLYDPSDQFYTHISFHLPNYTLLVIINGLSSIEPGLYLYPGYHYYNSGSILHDTAKMIFYPDIPTDLSPFNVESYIDRLLKLRAFQ